MTSGPSLQELVEGLVLGVERLQPLPGLLETEQGADLRELLLLNLRVKVLPELRSSGELPVFVGVQGGANVGKSTVFNALVGKILSPSILLAAATKHPLVFVHEKWRSTFFPDSPFTALECLELEDPRDLTLEPERTERLYFRFHEDAELEHHAIIDSPDFDSTLLSNLEVALKITALSDVTFFVTTAQKYRDRELVERLRHLMELKSRVILVFNRVSEEIVFNTLLGDLEEVVDLKSRGVKAIRLPESGGAHPEEDLREALREPFQEEVAGLSGADIKPGIVRKTLRRVLESVEELRRRYAPEVEFKEALLEEARQTLEVEVQAYRVKFDLAFPEETLAIRRILGMTELGQHLHLPSAVEGGSNVFKLLALGLRRGQEALRDVLVRLTPSREGSIEDRPAALQEYANGRDEADTDRTLRGGERLRLTLESFCRESSPRSALARQLLGDFFTTQRVAAFPDDVQSYHRRLLEERPGRESELVESIDHWQMQHPMRVRLIFWSTLILKVAAGVILARVVPPDGVFSLLNWGLFALGYLGTSYLLALAVSFGVRRKIAFRKRRLECFRDTLEATLLEPLRGSAVELLSPEELESIENVAGRIAGHSDLAES